MDALRVGSLDADGRRAAGGQEQSQEAAERRDPPACRAMPQPAREERAWNAKVDAHRSRCRAKLKSSFSGIGSRPPIVRIQPATADGSTLSFDKAAEMSTVILVRQ
jgi:hypothetical protein